MNETGVVIADKLKVTLDRFSQFPIHLTTQMKNDESLFYVQLSKSEVTELVEYLTKALKEV